MKEGNLPKTLITALSSMVVIGLIAIVWLAVTRPTAPLQGTTVSTGKALVGGPFALTDHNGEPVTDADFRGEKMLIYFGFTYCPDVCPTSLHIMAGALGELGDKADRIQPIFITVDPERDTPELMKDYVSFFDERLIGLTGSMEEISAAAKAYRVYFKKVADPTSEAAYTMDHSSIVYLMDEKGDYVTHFTHEATPTQMAAKIRQLL